MQQVRPMGVSQAVMEINGNSQWGNEVTQMDLPHPMCSYASWNGASHHNVLSVDACKQTTVCLQSDPHVSAQDAVESQDNQVNDCLCFKALS